MLALRQRGRTGGVIARMTGLRVALLAVLLTTIVFSVPARASDWTPVASGVTADITGVEYQSAERFWFITSDGGVYRRTPSGFAAAWAPDGQRLNDIEVRGQAGFAVGVDGKILRSIDGGVTWERLERPVTTYDFNCGNTRPMSEVLAARFAGDDAVFAMSKGTELVLYTNLLKEGAPDSDPLINRYTTPDGPACKLRNAFSEGASDAWFVDQNTGFFTGQNSLVHVTTNRLASPAENRSGGTGGVNATIAGDASNPARQWVVTGAAGVYATADAWATQTSPRYTPPRPDGTALREVDWADGTVLAAGKPGVVYTSRDGSNFYRHAVDGQMGAADFLAVSLASRSDAAVGGAGGVLAITSAADRLPDMTPPAGTIIGPDRAIVSLPAAFALQAADEPGGSGLNPAATKWTWSGPALVNTLTAEFAFGSPGPHAIKAEFADLAGNVATATKTVQAVRAPVRRATRVVGGVRVTFTGPTGRCSPRTRAVRLRLRAAARRAVRSVAFSLDAERAHTDRRFPFQRRTSLRALAPGVHQASAKVRLRVQRRIRTATLRFYFLVCA